MGEDFLRTHQNSVLGIYCTTSAIYLVELIRKAENWRIAFTGTSQLQAEKADTLREDIAEQVKMLCLKENITTTNIAFCLPAEQVFSYKKDFPVLPAKEMREAVHWDIDANVPYAESTYWFGSSQDGQTTLLAALSEQDGENILQAFQHVGLHLYFLTLTAPLDQRLTVADGLEWHHQSFPFDTQVSEYVWDKNADQAFMAAASLAVPAAGRINLLPVCYQQDTWDWQKISRISILICLFCLGIVFLNNYRQLYDLQQQLAEQKQQINVLNRDAQRIAGLQSMADEKDALNHILVDLSAQRLSWYSILNQLGVLNVDDVWLTDVTLAENHILQLQGKAASYEALVDYMDNFAVENELFTGKPVLTHSEMNNQNLIIFTIQIQQERE